MVFFIFFLFFQGVEGMVHQICRGLSKKNIIKSEARSSRFPKRSKQTSLPKPQIPLPSGLENHPLLLENNDNKLCYLNSALNILYMVKEVREYLAREIEEGNGILKEIKKIFEKSKDNCRKLAELLEMGDGAQSCHEVLKKVVKLLPSSLLSSLSLIHQKIYCCKKCGESSTPPKPETTVEILLPEEGCLSLTELLNQDINKTCSRCNYPIQVFNDYQVTDSTRSIFISVLQADPMAIRDLDGDRIWNFFGARWVLKGAVIYLPDPEKYYGENGHSVSWTNHCGKWCRVSDKEMRVFEKFEEKKEDVEMMVFERILKR